MTAKFAMQQDPSLSPHDQEFERPPFNPPQKKRRLFFIIGALVLFVAGFFIMRAFFPSDASTMSEGNDAVPAAHGGFFQRLKRFMFSKNTGLEGEKNDRINILLLGMGGPGHDGPYLTDTIMIVSIKPSTRDVAFISIPRDLFVDIPGKGYNKINAANAYGEEAGAGGGLALAKKTVKKTFDTEISYVVRVDFRAFEEIIDEVEGVTIDVDRSFVDAEYPAPNFEFQTISFTQGVQTLSGDQALKFVRSRHGNNGEGSDFARSRRQQKVILALKEKLLSRETLTNPARIKNIFTSLSNHIATDMEFSDMVAFASLAKEFHINEIRTLTLDDSENGLLRSSQSMAGAYILVPKSGDFKKINNMIDHIFDPKTDETGTATSTVLGEKVGVLENNTPQQETPNFSDMNVEIQNGTWRAGLAARIQKQLEEKQLTVTTLGNTKERPLLASGVYATHDTVNPAALDMIKTALSIPIKQFKSGQFAFATNTDILVILGEDFEE